MNLYTIFGYYSIPPKCICTFTKADTGIGILYLCTKADPGIGILYSGIIVYYRHAYARFKIWHVKQMRMCAGWGWGGCNYGRRVLQLKCLHHHVPHPHVIQSVILMLLISDYYCHAALRPTFFCPFCSLSYFIRPHIACQLSGFNGSIAGAETCRLTASASYPLLRAPLAAMPQRSVTHPWPKLTPVPQTELPSPMRILPLLPSAWTPVPALPSAWPLVMWWSHSLVVSPCLRLAPLQPALHRGRHCHHRCQKTNRNCCRTRSCAGVCDAGC